VAQREQGGKNVLNKLEIARTAFNPISGQPILPGSSIKGAIRTALLESLRKRQGFKKSRDMESEILGGSFSTDPFRFLKISDGTFRRKIQKKGQDGSLQQVERRPRVCLQVNRKKRPNQYDAKGNVNTLLECIPANTPMAFLARWVVEQKRCSFGNMPSLQLDFATIASACNTFYKERFESESHILKEHNYAVNWATGVGKALGPGGFLQKMMDEGRGFLLRVGRHSGAESVTVDAPRSIKIMKGKGQSPEYAERATTLWLAADRKDQIDNMQPFGWIFVVRT
jgi:CRISPR-associated protein Csm5